jgi:hypothetical protein
MRVTLYTRHGCHLCEPVADELRRLQQDWGFILDNVDIDSDPSLVAEHGNWVPVVVVNGAVRFRGRINPVLLQRLFVAEARKEERS